ncbi:hypothetical protein PMAYCL1PPCAC_06558 [Pristionchus mayeri]|uniref:glutathione transferase n=1 Tax=Pristionchus mayeri TaxID=1317129 RepID=A0AAN5C427_9BILA|nr:hypothetical protein PMAYCL1PPCAC_06558 [Pristionchus mayeri]
MPSYKISYFPGRGLGEVSRQMFHLSGTPFEDHRVPMDEWPMYKDSTPFGQMPVLFVDGKPLPQSFAIARFLANQFGELRSSTSSFHSLVFRFAGKTPFEAAWVDALADQYKDYQNEIRPFMVVAYGFAQGDKEKLRKEVAEPAINKFFAILEKRAKDNGSNGHLVGNSLTWVDLLVSDHIGILESHIPNALSTFPLVNEIKKKTTTLPKLKEWIDKRPVTPF